MDEPLLGDVKQVKAFAERLNTVPQVARYSSGEHNEGWSIAHSFSDLEESFRKFLEIQLKLVTSEDVSGEGLNDLLLEIGDEFRHIAYHLSAPAFYSHLKSLSTAD